VATTGTPQRLQRLCCGRLFATHWDFVRYAQEQGLNLDFTTPPQRPDQKLPRLFEE